MMKEIQISILALRALGVVPKLAHKLQPETEAWTRKLERDIVARISAFTDSANPDVGPELQRHLRHLVNSVCDTLTANESSDFGFVRRYAIHRAEQKFPLDALLQSVAAAHRLFGPWIRDAALAVADESAQVRRVIAAVSGFMSNYFSAVSSVLTAEYVQQTRALAEVEGDRRTALFNLLLQGYDEADSYAADLLRRTGYLEQRQSFCIVTAQSVEPGEMKSRARAQRMANSLGDALSGLSIRSLVGIRDNLVTVVLSGKRRHSGWTAPQSKLADQAYPVLRKIGPAALIGLSADVPSSTHIPRALSEAKLALSVATVSERVMPFSRIPFHRLLVHLARDDIQSAIPAWLTPFMTADRKSRGALLATLRMYADADMNVLRTAKLLSLHPNSIYARLQKIDDLTGRNALGYRDLTELLLVAECFQSATARPQ